MFLTFGSYSLRLTTGTLDISFIVYSQRRHVSYSSHERSEIRWVLRVNGEGCGRNRQMKTKIRNKMENYSHENLLILDDSEPSMQSCFKLCTQPKSTSFTDKLLTGNFGNCEMTKEGRAKTYSLWNYLCFFS
jgi:hypothetical protein